MPETSQRSFNPEEYVRDLLRPLLDYPDEMILDVSVAGLTTVIEVFVKSTDYGKVVGRRGETIEAVMMILNKIRGNPTLKTKTAYIIRVFHLEERAT